MPGQEDGESGRQDGPAEQEPRVQPGPGERPCPDSERDGHQPEIDPGPPTRRLPGGGGPARAFTRSPGRPVPRRWSARYRGRRRVPRRSRNGPLVVRYATIRSASTGRYPAARRARPPSRRSGRAVPRTPPGRPCSPRRRPRRPGDADGDLLPVGDDGGQVDRRRIGLRQQPACGVHRIGHTRAGLRGSPGRAGRPAPPRTRPRSMTSPRPRRPASWSRQRSDRAPAVPGRVRPGAVQPGPGDQYQGRGQPHQPERARAGVARNPAHGRARRPVPADPRRERGVVRIGWGRRDVSRRVLIGRRGRQVVIVRHPAAGAVGLGEQAAQSCPDDVGVVAATGGRAAPVRR